MTHSLYFILPNNITMKNKAKLNYIYTHTLKHTYRTCNIQIIYNKITAVKHVLNKHQGDASTPCIRTNSGELIPCFTDGLSDCKHNRHGRCLGRMTSPVKKIDLDYLAQTMTMAGGCFNPMHQNERWGIDPLLYRRPVRLQTRQARTLFGAYDKLSGKKIDLDYLAQTMKMAGGCFNPIHQN